MLRTDFYIGCLVTFIKIPEEEEFSSACSGGADVTKQIHTGIPEHTVKTQHHLQASNQSDQQLENKVKKKSLSPKLWG